VTERRTVAVRRPTTLTKIMSTTNAQIARTGTTAGRGDSKKANSDMKRDDDR
jgi:hypothetical protein